MNEKFTNDLKKLIINISEELGKPILDEDIYILYQPKHHIPKKLPDGKMAVYSFYYNDEFLKIGQAFAHSKARYQSQHYNIHSARSNLAKSLVNDEKMAGIVNENNVGQWIKDNCERYDVIIDAKYGKFALNFIEGLMHYKFSPRYEK